MDCFLARNCSWSYGLLFMDIFFLILSRSTEGCILIESYISTIAESRDVHFVSLQRLTVSNKHFLLSRKGLASISCPWEYEQTTTVLASSAQRYMGKSRSYGSYCFYDKSLLSDSHSKLLGIAGDTQLPLNPDFSTCGFYPTRQLQQLVKHDISLTYTITSTTLIR